MHGNCFIQVRFEVLTAASMKMAVFWVVAPCSLVEIYRRFRSACCLHHQGGSYCNITWRESNYLTNRSEIDWCSLRLRVREEHLMGVSFCSDFHHTVEAQFCSNVNKGHCWITLLQQWPWIPLLHLAFLWLPCRRYLPWCVVKNTFGISVYSKEYILPGLFLSLS
jgi:hypothetical protein